MFTGISHIIWQADKPQVMQYEYSNQLKFPTEANAKIAARACSNDGIFRWRKNGCVSKEPKLKQKTFQAQKIKRKKQQTNKLKKVKFALQNHSTGLKKKKVF